MAAATTAIDRRSHDDLGLVTMASEASFRILEHPAQAPEESVDVTLTATFVVSTFRKFELALFPVIGRRGVSALFARSRYLVAAAHPWLANIDTTVDVPMDLVLLESLLLGQTSGNAAAGGRALLDAFYETLVSLVGASLTKRLLSSVFARSDDLHAVKDTSP